MNNPLLAIQSQYWAVRDYLSPVLKESKFKEHGRITPEEFVAAGDFLTYKFPVWQWQKAASGKGRDYLPAAKQYLITRNVPCFRRATTLNYTDEDEDAERLLSFLDEADEAPGPDGKLRKDVKRSSDEDWVETHVNRNPVATGGSGNLDEIPDMDETDTSAAVRSSGLDASNTDMERLKISDDDIPDMDEIPDMDDEGVATMEEEEGDEAEAILVRPTAAEMEKSKTRENLLQVRTYDCLISYDKHYQTPRFWLMGYDEDKKPLTPTQVFQDVPSDHAFKTMTMETFPHSGQLLASVHPCKHASVMKKFIDRMDAAQRPASPSSQETVEPAATGGKKKWGLGGMVKRVTGNVPTVSSLKKAGEEGDKSSEEQTGLQVDFYLVIFLKFIASIVPTIEVDSTTAF
ncbi:E2-like enzyme [Naganishia albida]|nr:E2-like enzyme [Naganishia albida]